MNTPRPVEDRTVAGLLLAIISFGTFSTMDVLVKALSANYAVTQLLFLNCLFSLIPVVGYAMLTGGLYNNIRTTKPGWHALRASIGVVGACSTYLAYSRMPVADAYALAFAAPLFITALSVPILGEKVGWRRWTAVGVGFIGVLIMLRPGAGVIGVGAIAALGGAFCYSVNMLIARRMRGTEKPASFAFYSTMTSLVAGAVTMPWLWETPDLTDLSMFAAAGLIGGCSVIALLTAFRLAPASVVAPFQYTQMIWGLLFGWLIWGTLPDRWLLIGASVVIASGLYILYRETILGRGAASRTAGASGAEPAMPVHQDRRP